MNAPIADQLKAEAARSLLERMAEKTKLVRFFRYNAAAKHGVPIDNDAIDIQIPEPTPAPASTQTQETTKTETSQTIVQPVLFKENDTKGSQLKGILQTLAAVVALGVAVWGGSKLTNNSEPIKESQGIVQPYQESPIQWLEDMGEHLP